MLESGEPDRDLSNTTLGRIGDGQAELTGDI